MKARGFALFELALLLSCACLVAVAIVVCAAISKRSATVLDLSCERTETRTYLYAMPVGRVIIMQRGTRKECAPPKPETEGNP